MSLNKVFEKAGIVSNATNIDLAKKIAFLVSYDSNIAADIVICDTLEYHKNSIFLFSSSFYKKEKRNINNLYFAVYKEMPDINFFTDAVVDFSDDIRNIIKKEKAAYKFREWIVK